MQSTHTNPLITPVAASPTAIIAARHIGPAKSPTQEAIAKMPFTSLGMIPEALADSIWNFSIIVKSTGLNTPRTNSKTAKQAIVGRKAKARNARANAV